jgi:hypothetical protein
VTLCSRHGGDLWWIRRPGPGPRATTTARQRGAGTLSPNVPRAPSESDVYVRFVVRPQISRRSRPLLHQFTRISRRSRPLLLLELLCVIFTRISRRWVRVKGRDRMVRPASLLSFYLSRGGACEPHPPAAMAKYNVVLKNRREWNQNRKRQAHGEPGTGKLKQRTAPVSMSGKRKRKLQRRQNRVRLRIFFLFLVRVSTAAMVRRL